MRLEIIKKHWQSACKLTDDLQPNQQFSAPQLVEYLNAHLPPKYEKMTKPKVKYLHDQGMLKPVKFGEGEVRTSWRYTTTDVRRALVVELLKKEEKLSIQESKGWLRSFEEAHLDETGSVQEPVITTQEIPNPLPPTPVSSAYALLRNRALGTLITSLGFGEAELTPPGCLIAIRVLKYIPEIPHISRLTWHMVYTMLEKEIWTLAVSDASFKAYVYPNLGKIQENRPEVVKMLPQHRWYFITLQDTANQYYEIVLGLPDVQQSSIVAINKSLSQRMNNEAIIKLSSFPGLSTLLRAAFVNRSDIKEGTTLSVLTDIIAYTSGTEVYCDILVPESFNHNEEKWLYVQEYSSNFPDQLKDKRIEIGQSLSGLCYRYRQSMIVEPTIDNDPRVAYFEEEGRPVAVAAIPAIAEEHVVGVIYVASRKQMNKYQPTFTKELIAGLKAFGYVCGDIIARDQIEVETVRSMSRVAALPLIQSFSYIEDLLHRVVDEMQKGVSLEQMIYSWVYLLALNIESTQQDAITQWLYEQGINLTGNFLANRLWNPSLKSPLLIGSSKVSNDQYVFAILQVIDLPEKKYKQAIIYLQHELNQMHIGRLAPEFYVSAVTFQYQTLRQLLREKGADGLVADLRERVQERLTAGPYFKRGHEALYTADLDRAVSEFEDALGYVPNSWYGYKHLAEAQMLQGTEKTIEQAIKTCTTALQLNPNYASAHCLLADCLSIQGKFGEALVEYEKSLSLDNTRRDFLTRYGLALAGMPSSEYQEAVQYFVQHAPELIQQRKQLKQPWDDAIDKFGRVRDLSIMENDTSEEQRNSRANYHYYRGYAYLQAGSINKAIDDFIRGRKLAPDNLQLAQAYSYALSLLSREEDDSKEVG